MTLQEAIPKRLKELIDERGITQYKLFKITGVPQSTISTILHATNKSFRLDIILLLSQGLGVSASEFFDSPYFDFNSLLIE